MFIAKLNTFVLHEPALIHIMGANNDGAGRADMKPKHHRLVLGERRGISSEIVHLGCEDVHGQAETRDVCVLKPLLHCHHVQVEFDGQSYPIGFRWLNIRFHNADGAIQHNDAFAYRTAVYVDERDVKITDKTTSEQEKSQKTSHEKSGEGAVGVEAAAPAGQKLGITGKASGKKGTEQTSAGKDGHEVTRELTLKEWNTAIQGSPANGGGVLYRIKSRDGSLEVPVQLHDDAMAGLPVQSSDRPVILRASVSVAAEGLSHQVPEKEANWVDKITPSCFARPKNHNLRLLELVLAKREMVQQLQAACPSNLSDEAVLCEQDITLERDGESGA